MNGPAPTPRARRVAVVGGGITGLAAAHRLIELDPACQVRLFEAGNRLGGVLHSERQDDFLLEFGADNFITNVPWALDLCRRVGLADQLLHTNSGRRRALVVRDGRLHPVPEGFMVMEPRALWPLVLSPLLSWRGKARVLGEYFVAARRDVKDESLASFATRRLGREAFERLVQPLAAGIYTADPEQLSLAATMPRFLEMERQHGGLIRAVRHSKSAGAGQGESGARYSLFVAPRDGMQALATATAARLPPETVRLNTRVSGLRRRPEGGWEITVAGAAAPEESREEFDAVILALPAHRAATLVQPVDDSLGSALGAIPYASSAVAILTYRQSQLARPPDGFGIVVPDVERRPMLAASFTSVKFTHRAPPGWTIVRVFFGGAARPELVSASDEELFTTAQTQMAELIGARGEPGLRRVERWHRAMPQYHLGHLERVADIRDRVARLPGLELAGNAYEGVGVPLCIKSGEAAAERILDAKLDRKEQA
ncbi:MAG TPA: protoporphyrinogen oxidase [Pirellulales bacterium]|nr:protoporphyrinogen oxidase [Pirellulales bacterium]